MKGKLLMIWVKCQGLKKKLEKKTCTFPNVISACVQKPLVWALIFHIKIKQLFRYQYLSWCEMHKALANDTKIK